jgi:hypothetical protein
MLSDVYRDGLTGYTNSKTDYESSEDQRMFVRRQCQKNATPAVYNASNDHHWTPAKMISKRTTKKSAKKSADQCHRDH